MASKIKLFRIAVSAGHGYFTAGKRCLKSIDPNETREWWLNARIATKVEELLKAYTGYELLRVDDPTGKQDITLSRRVSAANNWKADFYLSIHANAGIKGGKGGGIVVYVYTNPSNESLEWQYDLYVALIAETDLAGNRSNPKPKSGLKELRLTAMPAVLLELGFMDSTTDTPIILTEEFADQCATAIVKVIVERAGLMPKETATEKAPDEDQMYRIRKSWEDKKSQVMACRKLENAKKACPKGYGVYDKDGNEVYRVPEDKPQEVKCDYARDFDRSYNRTYTVKADGGLRLRSGANTSKHIYELMPDGSTFRCYGYHTGDWLYGVSASGKTGFCSKEYLR